MRLIIVTDEEHNLLDLVLRDHIDCINADQISLKDVDGLIKDIKVLLERIDQAK